MSTPLELSDNFTGTDGAAWNPALWTTRNVYGTSAAPTILSNQGRMQTLLGSTTDQEVIAYQDEVWSNFDMTIRFTFVDDGSTLGFPQIGYRIGTGLASGTPANGYVVVIASTLPSAPFGGTVALQKLPTYEFVTYLHEQPINSTNPFYYRLRIKNDLHQIKWWRADADEPPAWKFNVVDASFSAGQIFVGTFDTSLHDTVTIDWDDFHLTEIIPPDQGYRIGTSPVVAIKIGAVDVVTSYKAGVEVPVTWTP